MEVLKTAATIVNILICLSGAFVAYFWLTNWLIEKIWRGTRWQILLLDYALNYREFKKWKEEKRNSMLIKLH